MPHLVTSWPPDSAVDAAVTDGLRRHLAPRWGASGRRDFTIACRADDGALVGGVVGAVAWGWVYVDRLWVDVAHRGRGHGRALMAAVEAVARDHGCVGMHLDTFGDEALPFYERHGFEIWGSLEGLPPGGCKHALCKRLGAANASR